MTTTRTASTATRSSAPQILRAPGDDGRPPVYAGRYLGDVRVRQTPFGPVIDWELIDLESDDSAVAASGTVLTPATLTTVMDDAALRLVRDARIRAESPLYAELAAATG